MDGSGKHKRTSLLRKPTSRNRKLLISLRCSTRRRTPSSLKRERSPSVKENSLKPRPSSRQHQLLLRSGEWNQLEGPLVLLKRASRIREFGKPRLRQYAGR